MGKKRQTKAARRRRKRTMSNSDPLEAYVDESGSPGVSAGWFLTTIWLTAVSLLVLNWAVVHEFWGAHVPHHIKTPLNSMLVVATLLVVPLTHWLGGTKTNKLYAFWQPFAGGFRFVALQAVGWTIWGATIALILYYLYKGTVNVAKGVLASVGVGGVTSHLIILLSLHYFNSSSPSSLATVEEEETEEGKGEAGKKRRGRDRGSRSGGDDSNAKESKLSWWQLGFSGVTRLGALMAACSLILAMVVESLDLSTNTSARLGSIAVSCVLVSVPLTHFLAGRKKHQQGGWQAWQPGEGGNKFVLLQGMGWFLYALTIVAAFWCLYVGIVDRTRVTGLITGAGVGGVMSQGLVMWSLYHFDSSVSNRLCLARRRSARSRSQSQTRRSGLSAEVQPLPATPRRSKRLQQKQQNKVEVAEQQQVEETEEGIPDESPGSMAHFTWRDWKDIGALLPAEMWMDAKSFVIIFISYMQPIICVGIGAFWVGVAVLVPRGWIIVLVVGGLYSLTFRGAPHHTGAKSWPAFRYSTTLWGAVEHYFQTTLIKHGTKKLQTDTAYVFGFHPHGIFPVTCFAATRGPSWLQLFPGLEVDILGASVMFSVPWLRELVMWAGARDVSKSSIKHALTHERSILLVPGGQAEMRLCRGNISKQYYYTKHKGFVRQALKYGAPLVPVVSLNENQLLHNIEMPSVQSWTTKVLGFGLPLWVHGRWWSPLPHATPVTVVVGDPISVGGKPVENPSEDQVQAIHDKYYDAVRDLFERYREQAGIPHSELVYV